MLTCVVVHHHFRYMQIVGGIYVLYTVIFFFKQTINYEFFVLSFIDADLLNNTDYKQNLT